MCVCVCVSMFEAKAGRWGLTNMDIIRVCVCVCVCVKERMSNKNVTILHL